jgi:hypothetical protein
MPKNYGVSPEEFIKVWQESGNAAEVAAKLRMPREIVLSRSSEYRRRGVRLKKLRKSGRLDIAALNTIADSC